MKRTVLIIGIALLAALSISLFVVFNTGVLFAETDFADVTVVSADEDGLSSDAASEDTGVDETAPLLKLSYSGMTLPETNGETLIPVIPETGLTVTTEHGAALTKTRLDEKTWRLMAEKGGRSSSVTLTETGIGVCLITLQDSKGHSPEEIVDDIDLNRDAQLNILYIDGSGKLALDSAGIIITIHGRSGRWFAKKSYNLKLSGNVAQSLMGLPADTKFALNSMYEDQSKIRDALSSDCWQQISDEADNVDAHHYRYTELYIDGVYWGLYGFQQRITALSTHLTGNDGLVKISDSMSLEMPENLKNTFSVIRSIRDDDISSLLTNAFYGLIAGEETGLSLFDAENLMRIFVFIQTTAAQDNLYKNTAVIWRADRKLFTLTLFDMDLTFGLKWDASSPPLRVRFIPEFKTKNMMETAPTRLKPAAALLLYNGRFKKPLAELYFSLRETVLSEEALSGNAKELFDTVTESGAREREHIRWPEGAYTETNEEIESFIPARLAWCDEYFGAMLEEGRADMQAG